MSGSDTTPVLALWEGGVCSLCSRVLLTDAWCSRELSEVSRGLRVRCKKLFSSVRCCTAV